MGVVYHANYLVWFDRARTELMRDTGLTYKELEKQGVYLAELARLLAAADARAFDPALLRGALGHPQPTVRRQAALAAGRIGDPGAVDLLVAALRDSDRAVQAAAAFALGMLKDPRAVEPLA